MGILSKNTLKFLPKFRYVCRRNNYNSSSSMNSNPSLYIPKRHLNNDNNKPNKQQQQLLLKRFYGNTVNFGIQYFSTLSTDDENGQTFSPQDNFYLPFGVNKHPYPDFFGSCNGLLCFHDGYGKIVFWNPSTNEFKLLPDPPSLQRRPIRVYNSGFGYDLESEDYKFVLFACDVSQVHEWLQVNGPIQVELYSLKTDSWKQISYPKVYPGGPSLYINGIHYWLSMDSIISFDFASEKFSFLTYPKVELPCVSKIVEFDGSLGAIIYPRLGSKKSVQLWVMKDDQSWTREFTVDVPGVDRPLGFYGKDKLFFQESLHPFELLLFDCATGELKRLGIRDLRRKMELFPFVKSSVRLNGTSQLEELTDVGNNKAAEMATE